MSLANENSIQCEDDDDFFTCQVIHEEWLNDFLVEPDFFLDDLEPDFIPFQHKYSLHTATPTLPKSLHDIEPSPYSIFRLFFSEKQLQTIVKNTNLYAYKKNTESDQKDWNDLTLNELKIWLALVIYMGIFKLPAIKDYWVIDSYYPSHEVIKMMTIKRFNELGISQEHKKFRIQIVKELIKEATQNPLKRNTRNGENGETSEKKNDNKRFRVSDIFELPATRLIGHKTLHKVKFGVLNAM
ncbi:9252_t:CDS:2 [Entrophospora sp. SA101]|nr:9252_t:CDS:2 [Entrophospora sp. SA101]